MPPASASDVLPLNAGSVWGTPEEFAAESLDPSGWGEVVAATASGTAIGSFFESAQDAHYRSLTKDTGYDSVMDPEIDANPLYARHRDEFLLMANHEKAAILKSEINREAENERILANSSWLQKFTLFPIEVMGDPLTYLTAGAGTAWVGLGKGGLMAAKAAVGYSVGRTAAVGAAIGAVDAAGVVALNRQYRTDSTVFGDVSNIALSSVLTAGIGGLAAKYLTHAQMQHITKEVIGNLQDQIPNTHGAIGDATRAVRQFQAAGAKDVDELTADDFKIAGFSARQATSLLRAVNFTPGLYLGSVESRAANLLNLKLTNTGMAYNLHDTGMTVNSNVESARQIWAGKSGEAALEIERQYRLGKKALGKEGIGSMEAFGEAVTKNAVRLDEKAAPAAPGSYQEFLNNASRALLKYTDWSLERGIANRLHPEGFRGPKRAAGGGNWMTRIYKTDKIRSEPRLMKILIRESFKHDPKLMNPAPGDSGIDEVVDALYDTLAHNQVTDYSVPGDQLPAPMLKGPAKDRTYNISDLFETIDPETGKRIAFEDYIERNPFIILDRHSRAYGAEVELAGISTPNKADANGFQQGRPDLGNDITAIQQEYKDLIDAANGDLKRILKLSKQRDKVIRNVEGLVQKHRGTYHQDFNMTGRGMWMRVGNNMLPIFTMGGVLITSATDGVRATLGYGVRAAFRDGFPAMKKALRNIPLRSTDMERGDFVSELRSIGIGIERANHSRTHAFSDAIEYRIGENRWDRGSQWLNRGFYRFTGLPVWTDYWKTVSATVSSARMMRIINSGGAKSKGDIRWMSRLNLSADDQAFIKSLTKDGIIKKDEWGSWTFNKWDWDASSESTAAISKMATLHDADIKKLGKFDLKKATARADALYPKIPTNKTAARKLFTAQTAAVKKQDDARLKHIADAKAAHDATFDLKKVTAAADANWPKLPGGNSANGKAAAKKVEAARLKEIADAKAAHDAKFDLKTVTDEANTLYPKLPSPFTAKGTLRNTYVVAAKRQEEARVKHIADAKEAHTKKLSDLQKLRELQLTGLKRRADDVLSRFQQAIISETNRRVVTPGHGSVPLAAGHPVMRMVLAFKSFMFTALHKATLAGLQGPKLWLLSELLASHVVHMMEIYIKRLAKGEDPNDLTRDDNSFAQWNAMAVESNLFLALPSQIYNMAHRMSGRFIPDPAHMAAQAMGGPTLTGTGKQTQANVFGTLAGPAAGLAEDIADVMIAFGNLATEGKPFTESKRRKLSRLIPGYTYPLVKPLAEHFYIRDDPKGPISDTIENVSNAL
jgi:hypothetical protein